MIKINKLIKSKNGELALKDLILFIVTIVAIIIFIIAVVKIIVNI